MQINLVICPSSLYFLFIYRNEIISFNFSRLGRKMGNENEIGQYLLIGFTFSLYIGLFLKKYIYLPFSLIFAFLGLTTGSKAFIIGLAIIAIVMLFSFFGRKKWYLSCSLVLILVVVFIFVIQLPGFEFFKVRILDFLNFIGLADTNNVDYSSYYRVSMFLEGCRLFAFHPIIGWGTNGFMLNSSYDCYSHNSISELMCNYGLLGIFSFFLIIYYVCKKRNDEHNIFRICMQTLLIIFLFFGVMFTSKLYFMRIALLCGVNIEDISSKEGKIIFIK